MDPSQVSAVVVTRGNVDTKEVLKSIVAAGIKEIHVWNNLLNDFDVAVYGRYKALAKVAHHVVYVQDDDCLIPVGEVVAAYEPDRLVANMPTSRWNDYPDSALVGWGAIFDRLLPQTAFRKYSAALEADRIDVSEQQPGFFHRTCDVVFSALTPRTVIDVGFQHLPWAETEDRMFKQPGHKQERDEQLAYCRTVRSWDDDDRRGSSRHERAV